MSRKSKTKLELISILIEFKQHLNSPTICLEAVNILSWDRPLGGIYLNKEQALSMWLNKTL